MFNKINPQVNLGTIGHIAATLLLAQENLSAGSEMMWPPRGNTYRTARLREIACLAWDLAESVEMVGIEKGLIPEGDNANP